MEIFHRSVLCSIAYRFRVQGVAVDAVDLMIATHAKEDTNLTLVTNDERYSIETLD